MPHVSGYNDVFIEAFGRGVGDVPATPLMP
jgi:hypothetical protein